LTVLNLFGFATDLHAEENNEPPVISLNLEEAINLALEADRTLINSASGVGNSEAFPNNVFQSSDIPLIQKALRVSLDLNNTIVSDTCQRTEEVCQEFFLDMLSEFR
jgi:hypothetical protein